MIQVVAISGSLRKNSFNMAALRAAQELQPDGMNVSIADISRIPVFNEDTEAAGLPEAVSDLRRQADAADALLISTPEYNYSLPGVLKNTIDWLSRSYPGDPRGKPPLNAKPLGIMGVSVGRMGTSRAQLHLRQVCIYTNMLPLNRPEVLIGEAHSRFDARGELTDQPTRQFIRELLEGLLLWTHQLMAGLPVIAAPGKMAEAENVSASA